MIEWTTGENGWIVKDGVKYKYIYIYMDRYVKQLGKWRQMEKLWGKLWGGTGETREGGEMKVLGKKIELITCIRAALAVMESLSVSCSKKNGHMFWGRIMESER